MLHCMCNVQCAVCRLQAFIPHFCVCNISALKYVDRENEAINHVAFIRETVDTKISSEKSEDHVVVSYSLPPFAEMQLILEIVHANQAELRMTISGSHHIELDQLL